MITALPTRPDGQRELIACPSTTRLGYGAHDDSGNATDYHAGQVRYVVLPRGKKTQKLRIEAHIAAMKARNGAIVIERLDERRYAVTVGGIVRYVGTQEECQQRVAMLGQKEDRLDQDAALVRSVRQMR